ncbi:Tim17-domain-containing protein [Cylindrobasidium torrendii FP15055 ss-10]|uniref:Tim17-domain-containing protein n=1 Tax=Cylindrobasidium torrendii FP15055 ss-10 TaxID=1314674 RepID=A0A0D7BEG2_9AGAR|nr:Tim17-domain-containing protein [Cylindrobasidium torrendii FP15055 ss-10]
MYNPFGGLKTGAASSGSTSFAPSDDSAGPISANDLLLGAYDPTRLHPMADIGDKLDYLLLDDDKIVSTPEDSALPSRGWSDDLCYGTGTMYVGGLTLGGLWGIREGLSKHLAVSNARLRLNSVLNSITRRGTFMGNSAGVLALGYNGINSTVDAVRGKHDVFGSMGAAALTGALFKSTAGVKPALTAGIFMSGVAGGWSYLKRIV